MLAPDRMVHVRRATESDARGIAVLHARSESHALELTRGRTRTPTPPIEQGEFIWACNLRATSGDHRPWIAWTGDRTVGFVTAGPSRDNDAGTATGELYVFDLEMGEGFGSTASALLEHACADLARHGFAEVTTWVHARDVRLRELLLAAGWLQDRSRRLDHIHGVAVLELRYRHALAPGNYS